MTRPPNILLIQTDQLTASVLGAYGDPVCYAPNLDRLAEEGVVFENAYCNFPLCAPSRFSMATGMLASRIGAYDNGAELPASIPTYAHYLRAKGYHTCLSGKMHFVGPDQLHGFEERLTSDIYPADFSWGADWSTGEQRDVTDLSMLTRSGVCGRSVQIDYDTAATFHGARRIFDYARDPGDRPFFLHVSYTHPHDPYLCTREYWDLYEGQDIPDPAVADIPEAERDPHSLTVMGQSGLLGAYVTQEQITRSRRAYYGSVSFIDDQVGTLLDALDDSGQAEDTVIIFTSDHGEMLGERGMWLKKVFFEPSLKIPFILHAPSKFAPARVRELVSLVDLLPTLLDLAGTDGPDGSAGPADELDGTSMLDTLNAPSSDPQRPLYAEIMADGTPAPIFMIRRGRHKYTTSGAFDPQLFDLEADPHELHNLAGSPDHADILATFAQEAADKWDASGLTQAILLSQRRRAMVHSALSFGRPAPWDHDPGGRDAAWFRGRSRYNDWAFDYLPPQD